jgi:hypothetical protein
MSKFDLKLELMRDSEVELIKDFLKIKGYRRTLECLIKEERYKSIENRNLKVSINIINKYIISNIIKKDRNFRSRRKTIKIYSIYKR